MSKRQPSILTGKNWSRKENHSLSTSYCSCLQFPQVDLLDLMDLLVEEYQKLAKFGGKTIFWLNPIQKRTQSFIKHLPPHFKPHKLPIFRILLNFVSPTSPSLPPPPQLHGILYPNTLFQFDHLMKAIEEW